MTDGCAVPANIFRAGWATIVGEAHVLAQVMTMYPIIQKAQLTVLTGSNLAGLTSNVADIMHFFSSVVVAQPLATATPPEVLAVNAAKQ
jgi:enterochelin esterase-like enzyme